MKRFGFDEYVNLKSPVHAWHPQCKLVGIGILIFTISGLQDGRTLAVAALITASLYKLSQLPIKFWQQRLQIPGIILAAMVGILPLIRGNTILWQWGILSIRQEGLFSALAISTRFVLMLTLALILFGTAPFLTIVQSMRRLGLPAILADMLLLAYRYLSEIAENLSALQRAMRLRGFTFTQFNYRYLSIIAAIIGTLIIRSYEQSERIYHAMRLRGYGLFPLGGTLKSPKQQDWMIAGLMIAIALCLIVMEILS